MPTINPIIKKPILQEKPRIQEKMSLAGIGNANKPATKKDMNDLKYFFLNHVNK